MIKTDNIREHVVTGLNGYLKVPVIRSNQNQKPPPYPYVVYTITTLESANNGTFGEYADGIDRKAVTQVWSISAVAETNDESVELASKAKEWLDHIGTFYLNENDVIVQSSTGITNRDNVLSVEYEYRNGFDVVFWTYSEVGNPLDGTGYIETVKIKDEEISPDEEMTYILQLPDGSEYTAIVVGEETVFTATANDIRKDKIAGTEKGVTVGTKVIPPYHTTTGKKIIKAGEQFEIPTNNYDYTELQAVICDFNTSLNDSVSSEMVAINDKVYPVQSIETVGTVIKNSDNNSIDFGFSNESKTPKVIRFFCYKEEY